MESKRVAPAKKMTRRELAESMRKLTDADVYEARMRHMWDGESISSIARSLKVCRTTARRAIYGEGIYEGV